MNALIKIPSAEFNEDVFNKIKSLISLMRNAEVTIAVSNTSEGRALNEPGVEYLKKIDESIEDIKNGKGTVFTMSELEEYLQISQGK